jgi:branched-chain amino acid aminotransferase
MAEFSKTRTFYKGEWLEGNPPIMGPRAHAFWLASSVFDGGRVFEGVMPDIALHAARINRSASTMGLKATMSEQAIIDLTREGSKLFDGKTALYVRPMYWGVGENPQSVILPDPDSTDFCLCLYEAPMREPSGISVTLSPFRRPTLECALTDAKSGSLYPNNARAIAEAKRRGFDNCLVMDMLGNIAETGSSNIFMAKDGVVYTPIPNGTFLNGVTRQRVISLMRDAGINVVEKSLSHKDFLEADEIFISGNYSKVAPVTKIEGRDLQIGHFYAKARKAYWYFAHS